MTQQQLLLLTLGAVIVGMAVLGSASLLRSHARQSEADALLTRGLDVAAAGIRWRSAPFSGSDGRYDGLRSHGLAALGLDSTTVQGRFRITRATADSLEVTGVSTRYPEIGVRVHVGGAAVAATEVAFDGSLGLEETVGLPPAALRPEGAVGPAR